MSRIATGDKLRREVEALADLTREELVARWRKAHGCVPPSGVRREILIHSAAWHLQCRRLGGLSAMTRRQLKEAMRRVEVGLLRKSSNLLNGNDEVAKEVKTARDSAMPASDKTRRALSPGARLVREWNSKTHVVEVIETGFVFEGRVFRSLSAIARRITGVQWSGPRFFGL